MRKLVLFSTIVLVVLLTTRCEFFEKKRAGKDKLDTLVEYKLKLDSIRKADSLNKIQIAREKEIAKQDSIAKANEAERIKNEQKYHLIVGSFITPKYADYLSSKMKGKGYNDAKIIIKENGNNLVSIQSFIKFEEAIAELKNLRTKDEFAVWLYARK